MAEKWHILKLANYCINRSLCSLIAVVHQLTTGVYIGRVGFDNICTCFVVLAVKGGFLL